MVRCAIRKLVGTERRIVILLDWTQLHGEFWALIAAVPFMGRSIPIYSETHHETTLGSRDVQSNFVRELRRLLPDRCRPVIVADGGFRSPFFVACREVGVDYVIRLRNDRAMARIHQPRNPSAWRDGVSFREIFSWARGAARCLGLGVPFLTSQVCDLCRLILAPAPRKARRRARYADDYERKRACEPWLLATSLDNEAAQTVVDIYATRMQVEECFRDAKSPRFGWGLDFSKSRSTQRLDALLLLVSLAFAAVVFVGAAASDQGLERRFRASSRKERVLSVFSVG
ncbi:MAG: IS4 family transposase, partial [Thermoanaerobaculia bacterium]